MPTPIATASLSAPVKALAVAGALYSLDSAPDGAGPWAGAWAFPEAPVWTEEDRAAWTQVQGHKIAVTRQLEAAVAALDSAAASPAAMLTLARIEVSEVQRAKDAAERKAAGEAAWLKAREAMGDRCARVDGEEGDVFILRRMTDLEITLTEHMAETTAAKHPDNSVMQKTERSGVRMEALVKTLVHPPVDRAKMMLAEYPLLVGRLYFEKDKLISGWRADQGKDSAL